MNRVKYFLILLSASLVIFVSGCGIFPPPFFFHSHNFFDEFKERKETKIHFNFDDYFHNRLEEKIHDKLEKMKIKIKLRNDKLDMKLNNMHENVKHLHFKLDSLDKEFIIKNDSLSSDFDIEIDLEKLEGLINSLEDEVEEE